MDFTPTLKILSNRYDKFSVYTSKVSGKIVLITVFIKLSILNLNLIMEPIFIGVKLEGRLFLMN